MISDAAHEGEEDMDHPDAQAGTPTQFPPVEPILDADDIQGNAVPGFMKPFMALSALSIEHAGSAKAWISRMAPNFTTLAQAMETRMKVRRLRGYRRNPATTLNAMPDDVDDAWVNVGFSYQGLQKLLEGSSEGTSELDEFQDEAFQLGLAARSPLLGDPTDPTAEGNPANWVVGGPRSEPDVLLVFGADRGEKLASILEEVRGDATASGMKVVYEEQGEKLNAIGTEHFGFQDGISQPGVRGRLSDGPADYVTPRTIASTAVPETWMYGLPGQYLVWPGEFVFGYPAQGADPLLPGTVNLPGPAWSRNGSYLVFRRLRQDVAAFWDFAIEQARAVSQQPGFEGMTPARFAANLIGRWQSGAPVSRTPDQDIPKLGVDRLANNQFGFASDSTTLPLGGGGSTNGYAEAKADPIGLICPMAAHIRKVNSRETGNDQGGRRASFSRRLLRRGLPFGPPLPDPQGPDPVNGNRGLLFVSYQASITDQFEFLCSSWMNDPTTPRSPSGHDMVVGENGQPGQDRVRSCTMLGTDGNSAQVSTQKEFVIPTGGGYFFSPSITAMQEVLAG
jgi:Dyp-type peroxidase family